MAVRDTQNRVGVVLSFNADAWRAFLAGLPRDQHRCAPDVSAETSGAIASAHESGRGDLLPEMMRETPTT
jgi:uncharacterized protein DUF397